jgi:excisionase family DNA binding protein
MSIKEFCAAHRISLRCFYNLIEDGTAPATFRVGRCVRISVEAAEAWMARQEAANAAMNITTNVVT